MPLTSKPAIGNGFLMAKERLGTEVAYLESQQQGDYEPNIREFLDLGYDLIVTVGFMRGRNRRG